MPKFRKKPVVVEAEQWDGSRGFKGVCYCTPPPERAHVHTTHYGQKADLMVGDWIIPGLDGKHFDACKSDVFVATYELVE